MKYGLIHALSQAAAHPNSFAQLQSILSMTAKLSAEELFEHQQDRLQRVVEHASQHVPWYQEKFGKLSREDINPDTMRKLPILSRAEAQQNNELLTNRTDRAFIVGSNSTSGSTGAPLKTDKSYPSNNVFGAIRDRFHQWGGRDGNNKIAFITAVTDLSRSQPPHGSHGGMWRIGYPKGTTATLTLAAPVEQQLDWLIRERPDYLATYPSNALELLSLSRDREVTVPNLCNVIASSERIPDCLENECSEVWGAKLTYTYSANEVGAIGLGHRDYSGYLVQVENVYLEIVDDDDEPCPIGKPGRILLTTLQDDLRPLIRYEIGDYGEFGELHKGIGYPVIQRINGRVRNMLTLPDGDMMWPFFSVDPMIKLGLKQWQLIQTSIDHIKAKLVTDKPLTKEQELTFSNIVNEFLPVHFDVTIEYEDVIDRDSSKKFEDFVNQVV